MLYYIGGCEPGRDSGLGRTQVSRIPPHEAPGTINPWDKHAQDTRTGLIIVTLPEIGPPFTQGRGVRITQDLSYHKLNELLTKDLRSSNFTVFGFGLLINLKV